MSVQRMTRSSNLAIVRNFHVSTATLAKVPAKKPIGGKTKVKQGFRTKNDSDDSRVRKGGMTHLTFKDAVRQLGFEKLAKPLDTVPELDPKDLKVGQVAVYPPQNQERLSMLGGFKKYQHHELFAKPISIISENLSELSAKFLSKFQNGTLSNQNRLILLGDYRVGKSTLLTQVQSLLMSSNPNAVILHLDYPDKITDGSSDYIFNKRLNVYQQPMLTKRWIMKVREVNKEAFSKIKLSQDVKFTTKKVDYHYKAGENNLYEYLTNCYDFGKFEATGAFEFFINELKSNSKQFPILLSIDNFNALTTSPLTQYKHADFTPIHFTEFEIGKFVVEAVGGETKFTGGILLSESNDIGKHDNLSVALGLKPLDPYQHKQLDIPLIEKLNGIEVFDVKNLSKTTTKALCQFYHNQGILFVRDNYKRNERELQLDLNQVIDLNFSRSAGNPGLLIKHVTMSFN